MIGSPLGLTKVIAASVRVNTVRSTGSTTTAVLASTLCLSFGTSYQRPMKVEDVEDATKVEAGEEVLT